MSTHEETKTLVGNSVLIEHDPKKGIIQKVKVFPPTFNSEYKKIENSAIVEDYQSSPEVKYRISYLQEAN